MTRPTTTPSRCSACANNHGCADTERRQLLGGAAAIGLLSSFPFLAAHAQEAANSPLLLVDADAEADFKPLRASDLALGKPLLVFPFDVKAGAPKNQSRANKLVVIRLPEDQMETATKGRSAGGVLAYSALCTHQACDVKTWIAKEKVLVCFCHASKFDLLDGAKVVDGPASRPLPSFRLKLEGEFLAIAPSSPANQGS
jgi:rieske iron-sulfur protein